MTEHRLPASRFHRLLGAALLGVLTFTLLALAGCKSKTPSDPQAGGTHAKSGREKVVTRSGNSSQTDEDLENDDRRSNGSEQPQPRTNGEEHAPNSNKSTSSERKPDQEPGVPPGATDVASAEQAPLQVHKPEVVLSQAHADTCLVGVGDAFPPLELTDSEGQSRQLSQLYGDRMTIVVFWNADNLYAQEQFARIMRETQVRYEPLGVRVVTINVGDTPEVVQQLANQFEVTIPCLLDPQAEAFAKVATELLPRTYLLDAEGRILWFDLEYSRGQQLGLRNAVFYHLKQGGV